MAKALSSVFQLSLCTLGCLYFSNDIAIAQVTSDGTVNTLVNQNGNVAEITGGETRGGNLFHSFQDFSVGTGNEAFFNNADSISNIFSRVTGGNISNIDGAIRANGSASLFLINPAGIIFGENARLDIGGSFYGTSATSVLFEDGEFSAADLENPPLLTVNAPIGLGFRDNPGDIMSRSRIDNLGLKVEIGKNIALLGGNINIEGGIITALEGMIELGAVATGIVEISQENNLNFDQVTDRKNISLSNNSFINTVGEGGGLIAVYGKNIELIGESSLTAGIGSSSSSSTTKAGNIVIDASESLKLEEASVIRNNVSRDGSGDAGNINVSATSIFITDDSRLVSVSQGQGDSGNVIINAAQDIFLEDGEIKSQISTTGEGNSGNIEINTSSLTLTPQLEKSSLIFTNVLGQGNAGNIIIISSQDIVLDNSGIQTKLSKNAQGNAGRVEITATNLSIINDSFILSDTQGLGDAGNTIIDTSNSVFIDDSAIVSGVGLGDINSLAEGNGGDISITTNTFSLVNTSRIFSNVAKGNGDAGNVIINANNVSLNSSSILSTLNGIGNAGNVIINANNVSLNSSSILSTLNGIGNAGNVIINANNVSLNSSSILSTLNGIGNAGNIIISGEFISLFDSNIQTKVRENAQGNAGNLEINAINFSLLNKSLILFDTQGMGNAGNAIINASNTVIVDDSTIVGGVGLGDISNLAQGNGGDLEINANSILFQNGSQASMNVKRGQGDAGNLTINANSVILNSSSFSSTLEGEGSAGDINIIANNIKVLNDSQINVSAFGKGDGGDIFIQANNLNLNRGSIFAANQPSETNILANTNPIGGNVNLELTDNLILRNNSSISARAFRETNGGNLDIDAKFIVAFPGGNNDILASAEQGNGGNININAESLFGIREGRARDGNRTNDIDASSQFNLDGEVTINTPDINPAQGATELSTDVIVPEETSQQACEANRELAAQNGLNITGKGGIVPDPALPLNSLNVNVSGESTSAKAIPAPIETSQGKIQPARGVEITESGQVILTAYRTNNAGERLPEIKRNCSSS